MLFEYILKIGLAGEAEIAADLSQAFFAVGEQAFGFLQLAPHDVSPHLDAQLTFEMFHHIRGAPACVGCRVLHGDRFVCMIPDIGHACVDVRRNAIRYTGITGPLAEIQKHHVLKLVDLFDGPDLFTFLNIIIHELVGLLNIHAARDRTHHTCFYCGTDKNIFGMTQR